MGEERLSLYSAGQQQEYLRNFSFYRTPSGNYPDIFVIKYGFGAYYGNEKKLKKFFQKTLDIFAEM